MLLRMASGSAVLLLLGRFAGRAVPSAKAALPCLVLPFLPYPSGSAICTAHKFCSTGQWLVPLWVCLLTVLCAFAVLLATSLALQAAQHQNLQTISIMPQLPHPRAETHVALRLSLCHWQRQFCPLFCNTPVMPSDFAAEAETAATFVFCPCCCVCICNMYSRIHVADHV